MTLKTAVSLFLLACCSYTALAQKLTFRQMDVRQGLPASEVYNLHQDAKGYVWAFTEYGIVKHNGTRFIPVCKNLPSSESAVYAVAKSPDGTFYIANSNARIYRIVADSAVLLPGIEKASAEISDHNETILYLAVDEKAVWFASHIRSRKYDLKTRRIRSMCTHTHPTGGITFQLTGADGIVPKCTHVDKRKRNSTMRLVDGRNREVFSIPFFYTLYGRNGLLRNGNRYYIMSVNTVMLAGRKGILRKREFQKGTLNMQLAPNGHVWLGLAYGGLFELDAELNILRHYLPGATISDILFDDQGGMWVSTIGRGVFYCPNRQRTSYNEVPELSESITLLKVVHRQLFIGTASGKLFVYTNNGLQEIALRQNDIGINDIAADGDAYFVGAKSGIFQLNRQLVRVGSNSSENGGYAFAAQKNRHLLLVSATRVLEKLPGSDQFTFKLNARKPRCAAVGKDGTVFISTRKGLFVLSGSKLLLPGFLKPLRRKSISRLCPDNAGNVWICTSGDGLFRLSAGNRLVRYAGLPASVITDICFLRNKAVVIATNKGAFIASLRNGRFGAWMQLVDNEVVSAEEFDNKLYLGTKLGLTILDGDGLLKKPVYPFYLQSVSVSGKKVSPVNLQLEHYQNHVRFQFDLLAYAEAEKRLVYALKGPSPGRGTISGTQLYLQNLAPGQYRLEVYPVNRLKNGRQKGWIAAFYIAPAFWQTKLFLFTVIALSALAIVLVTRFVTHRLRRKTEAREQVTRLLAISRLTALKAQINPHFISNSLAAIQELVVSDQTEKANQYLARFSLLIRYLLNYSDQSVASVADELKIIDLIIELEQLRFSDKFVFRKEIDPDIAVEDLFIPPLITQPFIENAIWHGLLPLKGKRVPELLLKVVREDDRLILSIIDNGVGRRGQQSKNSEGHESKGTGLIRHRIENLNKLHAAKGAFIELTDLEDAAGEPAGMRVDIIFPTDMLNTLYDEQDQEHYY